MPRIDTGREDRLAYRRRLNRFCRMLGCAYLLMGVILCLAPWVHSARKPSKSPGKLAGAGALCILVGAGLWFGVRGKVFDRQAGTFTSWWGVVLPIHRSVVDLAGLQRLAILPTTRHGRERFQVALETSDEAPCEVFELPDHASARLAAVEVARFISLPCVDRTGPAPVEILAAAPMEATAFAAALGWPNLPDQMPVATHAMPPIAPIYGPTSGELNLPPSALPPETAQADFLPPDVPPGLEPRPAAPPVAAPPIAAPPVVAPLADLGPFMAPAGEPRGATTMASGLSQHSEIRLPGWRAAKDGRQVCDYARPFADNWRLVGKIALGATALILASGLFRVTRQGSMRGVLPAAMVGAVTLCVAVFTLAGRQRYRFDRVRGEVLAWRGLLLPLGRRRYDLDSFSVVVVAADPSHHDPSDEPSFVVGLVATRQVRLELLRTAHVDQARALAALVADFLELVVMDEA